MPTVTRPPVINFCPHPSIADDPASFTTLDIRVFDVLAAWRPSLFSHEWLAANGQPKSIDQLGQRQREQRTDIEQKIAKGDVLPQPVIGIGVLECLEIGAGRDVLLTLAALGVDNVCVHAPISMTKDIQKLLARRTSSQRERGAIMVYIFVAVALLALLTYVVSGSSRSTSSDTVTSGRLDALVSEQLAYMDAVQKANVTLRLRGCAQTRMSFYSPQYTGCCNNLTALPECKIFDSNGANISYRTVPAEILDTAQNAQTHYGKYMFDYQCLTGIGSSSASVCTTATSGDDLMMFIPFVNQAFCEAYNKKNGVALPTGAAPVVTGTIYGATGYTGIVDPANAFTTITSVSAIYAKSTACISLSSRYYVYYLLEPF